MITYTLVIGNCKLNLILRRLKEKDPTHPFCVTEAAVGITGRDWIGYYIPILCSVALSLAFLASLCGYIPVSNS